jgi:predicted transcriptional regulator
MKKFGLPVFSQHFKMGLGMGTGRAHLSQNVCSPYAQDIMKTDVATASPNEGLFDILICMLDEGQRRRPVIEDGKLIGQVTCRHLLKAIINFC